MVDAPERIWAYHNGNSQTYLASPNKFHNVEYVRADLYARLQEQVETLTTQSDRFCNKYLAALSRAEAAEAERDRLREALEKQDEADRLLDKGKDVAAMLAYAEAKELRLAALQKEPQP